LEVRVDRTATMRPFVRRPGRGLFDRAETKSAPKLELGDSQENANEAGGSKGGLNSGAFNDLAHNARVGREEPRRRRSSSLRVSQAKNVANKKRIKYGIVCSGTGWLWRLHTWTVMSNGRGPRSGPCSRCSGRSAEPEAVKGMQMCKAVARKVTPREHRAFEGGGGQPAKMFRARSRTS
jgi:hypothetical protein